MSDIQGVLLIDKPPAWTSHDVCNFIRKRFRIPKVGHTGTLDPQATGVLVLLLGRATKLSARFMSEEKAYVGTMELGKTTTTQDGEGDVIEERDWQGVSKDAILKAFKQFRGPQKQIPPMVSAIRSKGVRLYAMARRGIEVERTPRDVTIFSFECEKICLPHIDFSIITSKGTYVRTVVHDVGGVLGTGAFLKTLCRVRSGMFNLADCVSIDALKKLDTAAMLKPYVKQVLPKG